MVDLLTAFFIDHCEDCFLHVVHINSVHVVLAGFILETDHPSLV